MRQPLDDKEAKETFLEPGQLTVWRWLATHRFFPPNSGIDTRQNVLRGCASVSRSFDPIILDLYHPLFRIIKRVVSLSSR
jgi:hypothetical protein